MPRDGLNRGILVAAWRDSPAIGMDLTDAGRELGPVGKVVVSREQDPWHQILVTDVFCQLGEQLGCRAGMRTPIFTSSLNIIVPDVVWMPEEKWPDIDDDAPLATAPDLCVDVLSCNTVRARSIDSRVEAYLRSGAEEVIVVGHNGSIEIRGRDGLRSSSIYNVRLVLDASQSANY
jgi:Uma2 family endonuclease